MHVNPDQDECISLSLFFLIQEVMNYTSVRAHVRGCFLFLFFFGLEGEAGAGAGACVCSFNWC